MDRSRLIPVGKVVRTHGLRGALKIFPYGETLALQEPGAKLHLHSAGSPGKVELTLLHLRTQGRHLVAQFAEIPDVDAAQGVLEQEVFVPEECLPPAAEGEYYHYQLIGLRAETVAGKEIGILRGVIETGGNDVYVIAHSTGEVLIPAIVEVILEVDLQRGRMIIDPPEGLLDDL
jgi:16S rRNA processing protein RimM